MNIQLYMYYVSSFSRYNIIYNMFKNIYFIRSFLSIMFIQTIYILINYMTFNNLFTLTKCIIYWKVVNISRKENIYP